MKKIVFLMLFAILPASLYASQSTIIEAEGQGCMGEDKSMKEAKQNALVDAKRKAAEYAMTYIKSETQIKDFQLEKDLINAYTNARIKIIESKEIGWVKDEHAGECFNVWIRAEVIPDEKAIEKVSKANSDDPSAPLAISVWSDKKEYVKGEKIKVYLKGNKPFYARVVYKDASGELLQLLPNPLRQSNYFNGGVIYEIPSGEDNFDLEVTPPFGSENIIVYASTSQIGEIALKATGGVYEIKTSPKDVESKSRGVEIKAKGLDNGEKNVAEFFEAKTTLKTNK